MGTEPIKRRLRTAIWIIAAAICVTGAYAVGYVSLTAKVMEWNYAIRRECSSPPLVDLFIPAVCIEARLRDKDVHLSSNGNGAADFVYTYTALSPHRR